VSQPT